MRELVIRALAAGDPGAAVADALLRDALPTSAWRASDELRKPHALALLAEQDAAPVGALVAWLVVDEAHLLAVGVTDGARRRGVGEALLGALSREAEGRGCTRILLEVDGGNIAARGLYAKLGFVEVNVRRGYYADGGDAIELSADVRRVRDGR